MTAWAFKGSEWTLFWDMHSGGRTKVKPYNKIYIEAPEDEAIQIFYRRFGRNPHRVTCTCCGEDYSISESPSFAQASGFHRGCRHTQTRNPKTGLFDQDGAYTEEPAKEFALHEYKTVAEYMKSPDVLVIPAVEITKQEREPIDLPAEGYVWTGDE